jgi:hypothetical protein
MDRMFLSASAVAAGYVIAIAISSATNEVLSLDNPRTMFVAGVIALGGVASAAAGIRSLPRPVRTLLGAAATASLAAIAILGSPFTVGLFLGVLLAAAGTAALLDGPGTERRTQLAAGFVFVATFGVVLSTLVSR